MDRLASDANFAFLGLIPKIFVFARKQPLTSVGIAIHPIEIEGDTMFTFKSFLTVFIVSIAAMGQLGCGGDSPRQVQETPELSFDDVAAQIDRENASDQEE